MQINYIILAHEKPLQLFRLVEQLRSDETYFYIHLDLKASIDTFKFIEKENSQVIFIKRRVNCIWGDISIVQATLNCIDQIIADRKTGYTVLMSGQDYPLKSNAYISNFFQKNYGINYISLFALPSDIWKQQRGGLNRVEYYKINLSSRKLDFFIVPPLLDSLVFWRYDLFNSSKGISIIEAQLETFMKPRISPEYINNFYGGSQWWAFPIETVHFIKDFLKEHPDYLEFHSFTCVPDEIFFHTIIGNNPRLLAETENSVTYADWITKGPSSPLTFDISYYSELIEKGELFARKFDLRRDNLLDQLDLFLRM